MPTRWLAPNHMMLAGLYGDSLEWLSQRSLSPFSCLLSLSLSLFSLSLSLSALRLLHELRHEIGSMPTQPPAPVVVPSSSEASDDEEEEEVASEAVAAAGRGDAAELAAALRAEANSCRLLHLHLAVLTVLVTQTTHCSQARPN